ncbi:DUF6323 family protein [Fusibacter sp. 3D3]|uniref:DUF6323 family protein n=1 Tax=Fusibacter sp. 3D3 TaxID=1048380 RepID=UPI00085362DC|nr:DUF6323 family protein [Fusibacter sp. 3D3]GAU78972.1 hypothetical protein F3D3_3608 [Fusibacter sp. 3D3]
MFSLELLSQKLALEEILESNDRSGLYGLKLTSEDALVLIEARNQALISHGRIEVGSATIGKIIEAFLDSPYIQQADYVEILDDLIETFYYMKNEMFEVLSDDELIELMVKYYNGKSGGSIELLRDRDLDKVLRHIHNKF